MAYLGREAAKAPIVTADIPDDSITSAKIVADTIAAGDIAENAVGTLEIADSVTLVTPNLGTPSAVVLTSASGVLPAVVVQTGVTDAGSVTAGQVGEYINTTGWYDNMSDGTEHPIAVDWAAVPLVLTAGDWDVSFSGAIYSGATSAANRFECRFSTTSGSGVYSPAGHNTQGLTLLVGTPNSGNYQVVVSSPVFRVNLSSASTSFYLNIVRHGGGTAHGWAQATARRVR